jgi:hypothetical protein
LGQAIACLIDANKVIRGELKKTNRREAGQGGRRRCRRRNVSMGDHGIQPLKDEIKKEKEINKNWSVGFLHFETTANRNQHINMHVDKTHTHRYDYHHHYPDAFEMICCSTLGPH